MTSFFFPGPGCKAGCITSCVHILSFLTEVLSKVGANGRKIIVEMLNSFGFVLFPLLFPLRQHRM